MAERRPFSGSGRPSGPSGRGQRSRGASPQPARSGSHAASRPGRPSGPSARGGASRSQAPYGHGRPRGSAAPSRTGAPAGGHRARSASPQPARGPQRAAAAPRPSAAHRVAEAYVSLFHRSRAAAIALVAILVLLVAALVDFGLTFGRIYPGVSIGGVDVSGKTVPEAAAAVQAAYGDRLDTREALIFASDEAAASLDDLDAVLAAEELSEQLSFEEAQRNKQLWTATATSLNAQLPAEGLAREALAVGRADGGPFARIAAATGGRTVPVRADYSPEQFEALAEDIDSAIGEARVDFGIVVENGTARVTEGHDGSMVDRAVLAAELDRILLVDDGAVGSFVARADYAPLRIDQAAAQRTCDAVNALITPGAAFGYEGHAIDVPTATLGEWVATRVEPGADGAFQLSPYVDPEAAAPALVGLMNKEVQGAEVAVSFSKQGDQVTVTPHAQVAIPQLDDALARFDERTFGGYRRTGSWEGAPDYEPVDIEVTMHDGPLPFDEALSYGIVGEISSFTTQYSSTSSTKNRNHNIHLAASLLNDSITPANGGQWSFNAVAGNTDAAAGFLAAGVINNGKYETEDGGGVCQVATTVFNAVYDAGYPVVKRQAHSLYMESYPSGRDAAVSYPNLDLVWENDTDSDVLMATSCTDTSVTVALYGVDPGYVVETETGDWVEGERYGTVFEEDEDLPEGTSKVRTLGTDGSYIEVRRIVKDRDGNVVRQAQFTSNYQPIDQVIAYGPGTDVEELRQQQEEKDAEREKERERE